MMNVFALLVATSLGVSLPAPTGPHAVGTFSEGLVDGSRFETFTDDPDDHREIAIQYWYPAKPAAEAEPMHYLPKNEDAVQAVFGPGAAQPMGISPAKVDEFLRPLLTHSYEDAAVSDAMSAYPVLIFSHGFGGSRRQNTALVEDLVSHGYVVVGIDHAYCASATIVPDGDGSRIIGFDPGVDLRDAETRDESSAMLAKIWAADARFVADVLELGNAADSGHQLSGRMDLERLGIFGHSFGGATAGNACATDGRFKAGINMDGFPYGTDVAAGLKQPFLCMQGERAVADPTMLAMAGSTKEEFETLMDDFFANMKTFASGSGPGYLAIFTGMRHFNFSDFPFFGELTPFSRFVLGDIDSQRGHALIADLTRAFFERHLLGMDSTMPPASIASAEEVAFTSFVAE